MYAYFDGERWIEGLTARQIRGLAESGVILPDTRVRLPNGQEVAASRIQGLVFSVVETLPEPAQQETREPIHTVPVPTPHTNQQPHQRERFVPTRELYPFLEALRQRYAGIVRHLFIQTIVSVFASIAAGIAIIVVLADNFGLGIGITIMVVGCIGAALYDVFAQGYYARREEVLRITLSVEESNRRECRLLEDILEEMRNRR
jgi:hypothetical protein